MSIARRKERIQFEDFELSELEDYNEELETNRQALFREFSLSCDTRKKRKALASLASLTSLRSAAFVNAFDEALGLR